MRQYYASESEEICSVAFRSNDNHNDQQGGNAWLCLHTTMSIRLPSNLGMH